MPKSNPTLEKTAAEIADIVQGRLEGNPSIVVHGIAGLREAQADQVSFLDHNRYAALLATTQAAVILVPPDAEVPPGKTVIRVPQPSKAFGKLIDLITPPPIQHPSGISPQARIDPHAQVDPSASIQPFAVIEPGVRIGKNSIIGAGCYVGHDSIVGDDCLLYPHVTLRERSIVGNRVILHSGAVIGADGFGYDFVDGQFKKIPQVGYVQIDDDVEIGANTCIDRGRFGRTWVQRGVKIDNLVQLAHNVIIGEHSAIAAQAGLSGSTTVGKYVRIAGQVGTVGHIHVGDGAVLLAKSGVNHDIPPGKQVFGYPAQEHREALKTHANIRRISHLVEKVRELEKKLHDLSSTGKT